MELYKLMEEKVWVTKKMGNQEFMSPEKVTFENKKDEQIDSLKAIIYDLELSNDDMANQMYSKAQKYAAILQDYEDSMASLMKQKELISNKLAQSEYQNEGIKAKNINLQAEVELQRENEKIWTEKIQSLTANEANLKSLYKETQETLDYVRATIDERDCEISECHRANQVKDEVIEQQKQIIVEYLSEYKELSVQSESIRKQLAERNSLTAEQQESIRDLEDQLQIRQEEKIRVDQARNWREECRILAENTDSSENQRDESFLMNILEDQTDETKSKGVDPAAGNQYRRSRFGHAKDLLIVGLCVGVPVMGTLLVTGMTKILVHSMTGYDCFSLYSDCKFMQHFTSLHYIRPPPF